MAHEWQSRRSAFNHDWLKNRFLTATSSFLNVLNGLIEDPEAGKRFVHETLPQWPERMTEGSCLIADFETEMSPRNLFERSPLSRCGSATMKWLPDLVHFLWCHHLNADSLCADAQNALKKADAAYRGVAEVVQNFSGEVEALCPFRERFEAFRAACEQVSRMINRFPSEIKVV